MFARVYNGGSPQHFNSVQLEYNATVVRQTKIRRLMEIKRKFFARQTHLIFAKYSILLTIDQQQIDQHGPNLYAFKTFFSNSSKNNFVWKYMFRKTKVLNL